jgi:hypothetical protein
VSPRCGRCSGGPSSTSLWPAARPPGWSSRPGGPAGAARWATPGPASSSRRYAPPAGTRTWSCWWSGSTSSPAPAGGRRHRLGGRGRSAGWSRLVGSCCPSMPAGHSASASTAGRPSGGSARSVALRVQHAGAGVSLVLDGRGRMLVPVWLRQAAGPAGIGPARGSDGRRRRPSVGLNEPDAPADGGRGRCHRRRRQLRGGPPLGAPFCAGVTIGDDRLRRRPERYT